MNFLNTHWLEDHGYYSELSDIGVYPYNLDEDISDDPFVSDGPLPCVPDIEEPLIDIWDHDQPFDGEDDESWTFSL